MEKLILVGITTTMEKWSCHYLSDIPTVSCGYLRKIWDDTTSNQLIICPWTRFKPECAHECHISWKFLTVTLTAYRYKAGGLDIVSSQFLCLIGVVFAILPSSWEVQHPWFVSIGCKGIPYMLHLLLLVHWILCDIVCPVDGCFHHWSLVFYVVEN